MSHIDELLPAGDGLKAFNLLYRMVTQGVGAATTWEDAAWIIRLDLLFADLYFDGVERYLTAPDTAPTSWRTLMEKRRQPGIAAVQFALAGMSAHINRDLAVAVVHTWDAQGPADHGRDTPEFRDYLRVNTILDATEPPAMALLATGLFQLFDNLLSPVDGWTAMAVIHAARDLRVDQRRQPRRPRPPDGRRARVREHARRHRGRRGARRAGLRGLITSAAPPAAPAPA